MKNILIALFVGFSLNVFAQSNPFAPRMKFVNDTLDVGTIKKGAEGDFEFVFTNTGKDPLEIDSVLTECACIVTKYPKRDVRKGKQGVIKVSYYTERVGPINKTITIKSNALGGIHKIVLIGKVEEG